VLFDDPIEPSHEEVMDLYQNGTSSAVRGTRAHIVGPKEFYFFTLHPKRKEMSVHAKEMSQLLLAILLIWMLPWAIRKTYKVARDIPLRNKETRVCQDCNVSNNPSFDVCWKCGGKLSSETVAVKPKSTSALLSDLSNATKPKISKVWNGISKEFLIKLILVLGVLYLIVSIFKMLF
jgi:hypothetical protein